jgi:hypothetical protein
MKKLFATAIVLAALAGCANVAKIPPGDTVVGGRVALTLDTAWNQVNLPGDNSGATTWTMDGIALDLLQFYVGVKDGQRLGPPPVRDQRPIEFKAAMQAHEVVGLFQALYSRDGSAFSLEKLEPADFMGGKGFRFEYTVVRKVDNVKLSGLAWATVRNNELFAMTYTAPRIGFYPRHQAKVEQIAKSARIKA